MCACLVCLPRVIVQFSRIFSNQFSLFLRRRKKQKWKQNENDFTAITPSVVKCQESVRFFFFHLLNDFCLVCIFLLSIINMYLNRVIFIAWAMSFMWCSVCDKLSLICPGIYLYEDVKMRAQIIQISFQKRFIILSHCQKKLFLHAIDCNLVQVQWHIRKSEFGTLML